MKRWLKGIAVLALSIALIGCAGLPVCPVCSVTKQVAPKTDLDTAMELAQGGFPNETLGTLEWISEYDREGTPIHIILAFEPDTGLFYFVTLTDEICMILIYDPQAIDVENSFFGRAFYQGMLVYNDIVPREEALKSLQEQVFDPLKNLGKFNKESNRASEIGTVT